MSDAAEQIQRRMQGVRDQIDHDVDDVVQSAKRAIDWRSYVTKYPWASVGVAAAIGYLVVPRRLELRSPDVDTLLKLAQRNQLVVKANPSPEERKGVAGGLLEFLMHAALRGAVAFVGQQVGKLGGREAGKATGEGH